MLSPRQFPPLFNPHLFQVVHVEKSGAVLHHVLTRGMVPNTNLHQVLRPDIGQIGGMKVGSGVVCMRSSRSNSWISACRSM
jgi:hypothetical protein